ncbi:MAG: chemotaxis-specific protein-glutamate methyltransferase CheB [Actinomycetota bacterium]
MPDAATSPKVAGATRKILIVDDSPVVRRLIEHALTGVPGYRIVGQATNGEEALSRVRTLRPDAMVLDLEMPDMDGYQTLRALRRLDVDLDVVVFANVEPSELDRTAARVRAAGAQLVVKPIGVVDAEEAIEQIRQRLTAVLDADDRNGTASRDGGRTASVPQPSPAGSSGSARYPAVAPAATASERSDRSASDDAGQPPSRHAKVPRVVNALVIASSTGGPNALEAVLGRLRPPRVPIFIVQHIADGFSARLAERLDHVCSFPVSEAVDGLHPEPGSAYISPGGVHLTVERNEEGRGTIMRLRDYPPVNSCRPSADVLFQSAAQIYGAHQLGVVLTGIGQDGLDGCRELDRLGAPVLVQDEETSVVWGMPGAVAQAGLADEILPLDDIAARIERLSSLGAPSGRRRKDDVG